MTWAQVWLYYEAFKVHTYKREEEEYNSEDEKEEKTATLYPGMPGVKTGSDGVRRYGK